MRPIHFPEANMIFNKPESMTDEECGSLSAYRGEDQNGNKFVNTLWMPSKEDIEAIQSGRPIILSVYGGGLPPICLFTCDESGTPNQ